MERAAVFLERERRSPGCTTDHPCGGELSSQLQRQGKLSPALASREANREMPHDGKPGFRACCKCILNWHRSSLRFGWGVRSLHQGAQQLLQPGLSRGRWQCLAMLELHQAAGRPAKLHWNALLGFLLTSPPGEALRWKGNPLVHRQGGHCKLSSQESCAHGRKAS